LRLPQRPSDTALLGSSAWVSEGSPIPMPPLTSAAGPTLRPKKIAVLSAYTREMAESSSIEQFVRVTLSEAAAAALDKKMFSADLETTAAPAGLLGATTTVPPAAAGSDFPMSKDIGALVQALSLQGGGLNPVLIAAPAQFAALHLWTSEAARFYPIFASRALSAGTVVALERTSFVCSTGAEPEIETMSGASIHMESSAPASDLLTGSPVKSLFQTDLIGLKLRLPASWCLRNPQQIAIVSGTNW
jgi:Phage capsid family